MIRCQYKSMEKNLEVVYDNLLTFAEHMLHNGTPRSSTRETAEIDKVDIIPAEVGILSTAISLDLSICQKHLQQWVAI